MADPTVTIQYGGRTFTGRLVMSRQSGATYAFMRSVSAVLKFDFTPLSHQMITDVLLPMTKRNKSGRYRHGRIKHLRDWRRSLEKQMIRSGNIRAAYVRPSRATS